MDHQVKIGFIGQGWIGKNYADYFEERGFDIVRYALEEPYVANKDKIETCDVVFIAVPTPSTPEEGFMSDIVEEAVGLVGDGKIAVIRSTMIPGTTEMIQEKYPKKIVMHLPEFFTRHWIKSEIPNPERNIIGLPIDSKEYRAAAGTVFSILPKANYDLICTSKEAELIKYARNCMGYTRVIFTNLLYDLAQQFDVDWQKIEDATMADPLQGGYYVAPVSKGGRGAGGPCYIKDFAAFRDLYKEHVGESEGLAVIESMEKKNVKLLRDSNKDIDLLDGVYGKE